MPFRIRRDAKNWFKHIDKDSKEKGFATDFDILYICFIAGITEMRKKETRLEETNELVDYFPDKYQQRGKLIISLFLSAELKSMGVALNERKLVHTVVSRFIKPDSSSNLTDEGMKEFSKYVYGGYDVLLDWFDEQPRTLDYFLRSFKNQLDQRVSVV